MEITGIDTYKVQTQEDKGVVEKERESEEVVGVGGDAIQTTPNELIIDRDNYAKIHALSRQEQSQGLIYILNNLSNAWKGLLDESSQYI